VAAIIPASHRDLLERPICAVLATMLSNGFPQANVVWCDIDSGDVLISTTLERTKGRNMAARPVATVLVVDPDDGNRWVQIRGDVEITQTDAVDLVNRLARAYTNHDRYYGGVVDSGQQQLETRILCRIRPNRVTVDAIHK
jgi:PPOX class probable F420-dependent enzyme